MAYQLYTYQAKSADQVRADILRTISNGLTLNQGIATPNVGPNSDYYLIAQGVGNELAVVHANTVVQVDNNMPDTAGGTQLDRWLALVGLSRRAATGSTGNCSTACSVTTPVTVASGQPLTDTNGLRYQAVGGIYTPAAGYLVVPILSIDTGIATNHANADPLKWTSAPPFCSATGQVGLVGGSDGMSGGNDSEVGIDDPPRARLLSAMANPPRGGNAAQIAAWATASSAYVQASFVYPALLGPGTVFFVSVRQPQTVGPFSSTSKNRDVAAAIMTGTVIPYVQGQVPTFAYVVGSTAANVPADIAILLNLPSAPTASPPGPGGGWLDATPWPSSVGGSAPVTVTGVTNSTVFTVNATSTPTAGVSHIAWISSATWQMFTATVLAVSGSSGAYTITIDTPMTGIAPGAAIFPQAQNQAAYFAAVLNAFSTLGPGEWTASAPVLARSFRHPQPTNSWTYTLGAPFLKQLINVGPEVFDANWIYRSVGAGAPTVPGSITLDAFGNLTSTPPGVYVPRGLSWYAQ